MCRPRYPCAGIVRWMFAIGLAAAVCACASTESTRPSYGLQGDAIDQPLTTIPGDPERGRETLIGRDGNCLLCHAVPETGMRFMGNLAPPLTGVASRLSAGQMRLRIVDAMRVNPNTIMPSYHRIDGLNQVAEQWRGKPILSGQQIEDVVAYLLTLR